MDATGWGGAAVAALPWPPWRGLRAAPDGWWAPMMARGEAGLREAGGSAVGSAAERARDERFAEVVSANKDRVFRVALSVLGPQAAADAEDVTQEVFVRAHRALTRFRGESRLSTWLYRMAFNLAVDHRRRLVRSGTRVGDEALAGLPAPRPGGDPHGAAEAAERARRIAASMAELSEEQRAALHLHYWMGHTVAEIGALLGMAPGTVKSHLHRGRERLRGALGRSNRGAGPAGEER
jgi:RNA polymerase sigma-70 factor (ECF subfamily)